MIAHPVGYCTCDPLRGCDLCGATPTQHTRSNSGPIMGHSCYECYAAAVRKMWADYGEGKGE